MYGVYLTHTPNSHFVKPRKEMAFGLAAHKQNAGNHESDTSTISRRSLSQIIFVQTQHCSHNSSYTHRGSLHPQFKMQATDTMQAGT